MSNPHMESAREFTIGSVLGRTKTILFTQPLTFMGLAFITLVPTILTQLLGGGAPIETLGNLLNSILTVVLQGAFAYCVFQVLVGNSTSLGASLSRGMRRFFSIVGASSLIFLGMFFGCLLPVLPGIFLRSSFLMLAGVAVAFFLFLWFMCKWTVAIPACVVEHLGPIDSLRRSTELTKGYRLKIFGLLTLAFLLFLIFLFVLMMIYGLLLTLIATFAPLIVGKAITMLGLGVVLSLPIAFINVTYTTIYYDLRSTKEGIAVDSLANVFD